MQLALISIRVLVFVFCSHISEIMHKQRTEADRSSGSCCWDRGRVGWYRGQRVGERVVDVAIWHARRRRKKERRANEAVRTERPSAAAICGGVHCMLSFFVFNTHTCCVDASSHGYIATASGTRIHPRVVVIKLLYRLPPPYGPPPPPPPPMACLH
jgi:hypothetical protein